MPESDYVAWLQATDRAYYFTLRTRPQMSNYGMKIYVLSASAVTLKATV